VAPQPLWRACATLSLPIGAPYARLDDLRTGESIEFRSLSTLTLLKPGPVIVQNARRP
jgi:hypothetical protein